MEELNAFFELDWKSLFVALFTALLGFQIIVKASHWFLFEYLGIETKSMRNKKEEHKLVLATATGLKELSKKHADDAKWFSDRDKYTRECLNQFMEEMRQSVLETQKAVSEYSNNRVHDREQSREIQKELKDSISKLADSDLQRDKQIEKIITTQKETLADRINQKYKFYLSKNGIPEDEVDEFISLHAAYKSVGGNHSGDAKFKYCMDHLQLIPVDIKLKYDD